MMLSMWIAAFSVVTSSEDLSRGFNDQIAWVGHAEGLKLAKEQNKVSFHSSQLSPINFI